MYLFHNIVNSLIEVERGLTKIRLSGEDGTKYVLNRNVNALFHTCTELEIKITLKEAEKLHSGSEITTGDLREELVSNYIKTNTMTQSIAQNKVAVANYETILEIYASLGDRIYQAREMRFRMEGEKPSHEYNDTANLLAKEYENMNGETLSTKLIEEIYRDNEIPEIVRIGLMYFYLLRVQPLRSLNKLTINAFINLLFAKYMQNIPYSWSAEEFFGVNKSEIYKIIGKKEAEQEWLKLFINYLESKITDIASSITIANNGGSFAKNFLDLNKRQLRILKYLQTIPSIRREDFVEMTGVSAMTAYRDLNQLVEYKLLRVYGTGRGTKYMLASRLK